MALSGRGLFIAGATLLLAIGGIALAGTVGAASRPTGPELGPPVLVQVTSSASSTANPTSGTHHAEDDDRGTGPTVVGPAPAHEVEDEDDDHHRTTPPNR